MFEGEKVVSNGVFDEKLLIDMLLVQPAKYKGSSGTRRLSDNISDIKAQIAANARGTALIQALFEEYGEATVHLYMGAIQTTSKLSVQALLKKIHKEFGGKPLEAIDYMDDGSPIKLKITINGDEGTAIFDFDGTGPEVYGGWNAPIAITHSAIIYCLRCMISSDVPLNQGCLAPVDIRVPGKSILSPSKTAAVVGGNVVTSQRIIDVVLKAFRACAASQGDCNNLTFGMEVTTDETGKQIGGFGYYETIAGAFYTHKSLCSC